MKLKQQKFLRLFAVSAATYEIHALGDAANDCAAFEKTAANFLQLYALKRLLNSLYFSKNEPAENSTEEDIKKFHNRKDIQQRLEWEQELRCLAALQFCGLGEKRTKEEIKEELKEFLGCLTNPHEIYAHEKNGSLILSAFEHQAQKNK